VSVLAREPAPNPSFQRTAFGSRGLAQTLIEHDLVEEYRLLTFPVILGTGKRLFGAVPACLTLVRSNTTSRGVVVSVYRRGGDFRTGSFALD
jgi:dihydrofolate reductase